MKRYIYEGKSYEEVKKKALTELNTEEDNLIIRILEEKQSLLKKVVRIEVITVTEIINFLKETITTITKLMNIETNLEVRRRGQNIEIKIFSDHNSLLIGKNGKTLESLQNIVRQVLTQEIKNEYKVNLDIENYKEHKITNIERIAKRVAKEVATTKVEAKLDRMNSYERRIVHNTLSQNKYVYTESIGEEPNRYVVIKPKEEN